MFSSAKTRSGWAGYYGPHQLCLLPIKCSDRGGHRVEENAPCTAALDSHRLQAQALVHAALFHSLVVCRSLKKKKKRILLFCSAARVGSATFCTPSYRLGVAQDTQQPLRAPKTFAGTHSQSRFFSSSRNLMSTNSKKNHQVAKFTSVSGTACLVRLAHAVSCVLSCVVYISITSVCHGVLHTTLCTILQWLFFLSILCTFFYAVETTTYT